MKNLLVCIDGSAYADNICEAASWAAGQLKTGVDLLHVLRRHSDYQAPSDDHTGSIGLGARSNLLDELTEVDEERGRLDQKKGKLILAHGEKALKKAGINDVNTIHRRGDLVGTIQELEDDSEIIFLGKRGEHANTDSAFLGSNLEKVARAIHHPLFVVGVNLRPMKKFVVAYDGKDSVRKAVDYIAQSPLLKGMECHLLAVETHEGDIDVSQTQDKLEKAGFKVTVAVEQSGHADQVIASYVADNEMDLVVTGAYSHSRIRGILLGSTTATLIKTCLVPLLLFR